VKRFAMPLACLLLCGSAAQGLETTDRVVFHEVYYYVPGFDRHNEYIEIINAGTEVAHLDGAIITDEGEYGMPEGVFRFPGTPGGTLFPVEPGEIVLIAVDAVEGELEPDLRWADWEFWHSADDNDNPDVPNIEEVTGSNVDMALANEGDGLVLGTGTDVWPAINCATIVDGVNWDGVADPVPIGPSVCVDSAYAPACPQGNCLGRCPGGFDSDRSSASDWFVMIPSPGEENISMHPDHCTSRVPDGTGPSSWGVVKALYR